MADNDRPADTAGEAEGNLVHEGLDQLEPFFRATGFADLVTVSLQLQLDYALELDFVVND